MKILRIRRGYTTNSSGGNEWVPPKHLKLSEDGGVGRAPEGVSVEILSGKGETGWSPDAKQVTILAIHPGTSQTQTTGETGASQTGWRSVRGLSNMSLIGALLGAVCLLFAVTAFLRRLLGKKNGHE